MTRLRRSSTKGRGYHRVRSGKGFSYRDPYGTTVSDPEVRQRLEDLVIPPAWDDVWISPYENGHILATGIDGAGRRQYMYHPSWRDRMDKIKYDRALALAESLPAARRMVTQDLRRPDPDRRRALAAAFRMLDQGSLRVGSERYATEHGSHGLSTLLCSHAHISGDDIELGFPGKSHQAWSSTIHDADLARVLVGMKRRGANARLLSFRERRGDEWQPVTAEDINAYVKERAGDEFTAKDFRTLHGTVAAAVDLAQTGVLSSQAKRKKAISHAVKAASEVLGNTPTVARQSYIDPRLLDAYEHGETIDPARLHAAESEVRALLYRQ
ncbi:DNA topoisomerase IB [Curtobacterium sp. MCJR17_055]|uniref:DNA topoisomerase IB n=1 Tax=unclassified Curtobacterium TaxID=257496 RepID=UPI000D8D1794|nr:MULTISPECIES: DNA topoisomerase IB [unclassified Curtobacterium]PYY37683.1 DNA topoisomerase IB [Curtobacterium sp. MCBD17_029]PYY51628.1 DNA topoisomerase IB [Curtobacterium sp. MCBD17_023]PYY56711.1 DNA topoisomerase IB [Curtobacterium sp. MCJR17_055]PYY62374.1 DNA topoisomerase IB [Curtobacterium sp. MCPF17_015]WIB15324.1 DNA topoisomerase IB [Curtobacterium sp. MCPF17_050]